MHCLSILPSSHLRVSRRGPRSGSHAVQVLASNAAGSPANARIFVCAIPPDRFALHRECGRSHDKPLSDFATAICRCFAFRSGRNFFAPRSCESKQFANQRKRLQTKGQKARALDSIAREAIRSGCKRLQAIRSLREHPKHTTGASYCYGASLF